MQRSFTIELRVDYADAGKNPAMKKAVAQAARHLFATASLLKDQAQPQIAIFSDDFFGNHEDIALLEDTLATGAEALTAAGDTSDGAISDELLNAFKDDTITAAVTKEGE